MLHPHKKGNSLTHLMYFRTKSYGLLKLKHNFLSKKRKVMWGENCRMS